MKIQHLIPVLFLGLVVGCAQNHRMQTQTPELSDSGLSQAQIERVKGWEKDYGLQLNIYNNVIQFPSMGAIPPPTDQIWNKTINALHEAIGDDFTNYTLKYLAL